MTHVTPPRPRPKRRHQAAVLAAVAFVSIKVGYVAAKRRIARQKGSTRVTD